MPLLNNEIGRLWLSGLTTRRTSGKGTLLQKLPMLASSKYAWWVLHLQTRLSLLRVVSDYLQRPREARFHGVLPSSSSHCCTNLLLLYPQLHACRSCGNDSPWHHRPGCEHLQADSRHHSHLSANLQLFRNDPTMALPSALVLSCTCDLESGGRVLHLAWKDLQLALCHISVGLPHSACLHAHLLALHHDQGFHKTFWERRLEGASHSQKLGEQS